MCNRHDSFHNSWNSDYLLHDSLNDFHSWNFHYLFYNPIPVDFDNLGHYFFDVDGDRLLNFDWDVLDVSDNHRLFDDKFDRCKVLNEEGYLPIDDNQFFFNGPEWHYFLYENRLLLDNLFVDGHLSMTSHFYYSFFNVWLHEMAFLNDYLLGILFVDRLLDLNLDWLWFLAVAVLGVVNGLLYHNFGNFSHLMPLNNWFFNFNKLYFSLNNNVMDWPLHDFELGLFIYFGHSLLNFEDFVYLFVDIFGDLSFHLNLSGLNFRSVVGHLELLWNLLGH